MHSILTLVVSYTYTYTKMSIYTHGLLKNQKNMHKYINIYMYIYICTYICIHPNDLKCHFFSLKSQSIISFSGSLLQHFIDEMGPEIVGRWDRK